MRILLFCGLVATGLSATPPISPARDVEELRQQLHSALSSSGSSGSQWGVQVNSQRTGDTWFSTNASRHFVPASNTKLFTAALSLDRLGADYRLVTSLRIAAKPDAQGTLSGDLAVLGGGDPTRRARLNGGTWEKAFAPLVAAVQAAGIQRIAGDLICDESIFRGPPYGSGWNWDDLVYYYGAAVSALTAEDNCVEVAAHPGDRMEDPATLRLQPLSGGLTLLTQVITGPTNSLARLDLARLPGQPELTISGTIPLGSSSRVEKASVREPARWFGELFREALRLQGIKLDGRVMVVTAGDRTHSPVSPTWKELAAIPSPPLGEVVREMMKPSQNLYAQLLLLAVGAEAERHPRDDAEASLTGVATTEAAGLQVLQSFLPRLGIARNEVVLEEGSGLSRKNLVTPRAVIRLLEIMPSHRWGSAWMASMPIGGVDGTLRRRFTNPPTLGNVRAKTGSLRQVASLSGYLTNSAGEPLVFSILVNNFLPDQPDATAREEIDRLVEILAQSKVQ